MTNEDTQKLIEPIITKCVMEIIEFFEKLRLEHEEETVLNLIVVAEITAIILVQKFIYRKDQTIVFDSYTKCFKEILPEAIIEAFKAYRKVFDEEDKKNDTTATPKTI